MSERPTNLGRTGIMLVKSAPWTLEVFETSLHPEYAAIRSLVRKSASSFALVGIGGSRYERFSHPDLDLVFYNVACSNAVQGFVVYPFLFALVLLLRPRFVITMGIFIQIPVQFAADLVAADHITFLIGELFYVRQQLKIFHKFILFLLRIALKRTAVMLAISEAMRRDILKILGNSAYDIKVYRYRLSDIFRPGLPASVTVPSSRHPLVLTSCRIARRKGLGLVVSAATLVLRVLPETTFLVRGPIGDAGYLEELRRMILKERVERQVILVGEECAYEDLPAILSSADVFVHPSLDESLGISIMEALACGVPVVATRVGGIPEIVRHEVNGLLVDPTPSSIADAIIRILTDKELRDHLRRGATAFARHIREPTEADFDRMLDVKIRELWGHR